jgi:outer membrane protein assembly factor BamB
MKKFVAALAVLLTVLSIVSAQSRARLYSEPRLPAQADLDRLNLQMAWYANLPTDGRRDGIFSMQIGDKQHVVLLRSGAVIALDAATGATLWRTRVGVPYVPVVGFGTNNRLVFVAKGINVFALDKNDGKMIWEYQLPKAPSATPVADDERFFIALGTNRLHAFTLPTPETPLPPPVAKQPEPEAVPQARISMGSNFYSRRGASAFGVSGQSSSSVSAVSSLGQRVRSIGPLSSAIQARENLVAGPQPQPLWDYITETRPETRVEQASVLTTDSMLQAGANGLFFAISKYEPRILYQFQADAPISAAIGSYGKYAYIASDDFRVYALDIETGKNLWRFVAGGPIRQKARITDDSVYVSAERAGLYRLDRLSGDIVWRNQDGERFLAVNKKFVYANDRSGRLLVIDRARGTTLARYDGAQDYVVPLSNELNDRLFLASNDGLIVCLHDRDYPSPFRVKNVVEAPSTLNPNPSQPPREKSRLKAPAKEREKKAES